MPQSHFNWEQGDRGKESSCSPRGRARARSPEPSGDGGRRWREFAGGERRIAREQRARVERKKLSQATGSGREGFFKNGVWAHRTVYSACPVHTGQRTVAVWWTTGQRTGERGTGARVAGAPDSAQCSVRCTPDCPVSPDRGNFEIVQIFYLVFNQTKSQLIITQKNTCWDRYWHPHIFSHNFQNILP